MFQTIEHLDEGIMTAGEDRMRTYIGVERVKDVEGPGWDTDLDKSEMRNFLERKSKAFSKSCRNR